MPVGDPDEALRVLKRWEDIGVDGVIFGVGPLGPDHGRETLECVGKYIIPELDKDPVHLTTRFRDTVKTESITHSAVLREVETASPADEKVKKY